jgi:hypothetical protein
MNESVHSFRVAPLWAVLVLTIPAGVAAWGVVAAGYAGSLAGTPVMALLAYGLAAGYVNHIRVRAGAEGVTAEVGPLPVGMHAVWVPREEIARIYVRRAVMAAKPQPMRYLAAGVERADGRWLDLTEPLAPAESVLANAREMAAALDWGEPVEVLEEDPPGPNENQAAPWRLWAGLLAGGFVWAVYAEGR